MAQSRWTEGWGVARGLFLAALVGVLSGLASAAFLWALDLATETRGRQPWLLLLLPFAGAAIGWVYHRFGRDVAGGNNLLLDRIHDDGAPIPFRMAPLILLSTVATHLFGGSAGREGTAVQMGGTLADALAQPLRLGKDERRMLLMAGVAAGFGSVFGTPLAGTVFGMEVLGIGRVRTDALLPCLVASVVGDVVCRAAGIHHTAYHAAAAFALTPASVALVVLASLLYAAASVGFVELTHFFGALGKGVRGAAWVRPLIGGLAVVGLTLLVGNQDYNGLGIPLITRSFSGAVPPYAFALKILFTAITLGAGFKGGEVTPLFAIGATLGSAFAGATGQDPALFAALGFVAVFAGAANTPLSCVLMGMELFGAPLAVPLALACGLTFLLTGHRGIYASQRVHRRKVGCEELAEGTTLGELRRRS